MVLTRLVVVLIVVLGTLLAGLPESVSAGVRGGAGHRFGLGGTSSVVVVSPFRHPRPFSSFEFAPGTMTAGPRIITPRTFGIIDRQLLTPTTGMRIPTEITTVLPSPKFVFPSTPAVASPGQTVVLQRGSSIAVESVVSPSASGVQSESVTVIVQRGSSVVVESVTAR